MSLDPELSRASDFDNAAWFSPSVRAPVWEDMFVLTTITNQVLSSPRTNVRILPKISLNSLKQPRNGHSSPGNFEPAPPTAVSFAERPAKPAREPSPFSGSR